MDGLKRWCIHCKYFKYPPPRFRNPMMAFLFLFVSTWRLGNNSAYISLDSQGTQVQTRTRGNFYVHRDLLCPGPGVPTLRFSSLHCPDIPACSDPHCCHEGGPGSGEGGYPRPRLELTQRMTPPSQRPLFTGSQQCCPCTGGTVKHSIYGCLGHPGFSARLSPAGTSAASE